MARPVGVEYWNIFTGYDNGQRGDKMRSAKAVKAGIIVCFPRSGAEKIDGTIL